MKNVAYVRVSTDVQDTSNQIKRINEYIAFKDFKDCQYIDVEMSSRASFEDRRINELLALPTGSNILIYSLDRLGRSVREISNIIAQLRENGINLHVIDKSLVISASTDDINSTILVTILSLTAQIERDLISQRTKLALSRIRMFKKLGRPIKSKFDESKNIICDKSRSINSLAKEFGCSRNAIRHLRKTRTA